MTYTEMQQRYITVFMQHIRSKLTQDGHENTWLKTVLSLSNEGTRNLSETTKFINVLSAMVGIAGIISAPPTLGVSMGAAGTVIIAFRSGLAAYNFTKKHLGKPEATFLPDDACIEAARIAFDVLFGEVASTLAMQYRYFIDVMATNKGVNDMAHFAANAVMQEWLVLANKKKTITLEALITPLTQSTVLAQTTIEVHDAYRSSMFIDNYYAIGIYARPTIACLTEEANMSWSAHTTSKTKTRYGYRALTESLLPPTHHQPASPPDWSVIAPHLSAEYQIKYQDVVDYLTAQRSQQYEGSLNDYLSMRFSINLIATCHDETLKGLDLSQGNFADVNFRRANLQGCKLDNTQWTRAHLEHALFGDANNTLSLQNAQFYRAHLQATHWDHINFTNAQFIHAQMNGAILNYCQLGTLQHEGCTWDLAQFNNLETQNEDFINRLQLNDFIATTQTVQKRQADQLTHLEVDINKLKPVWPHQQEVPAKIPTPLHALYGTYQISFNSPQLQKTLQYYIEPDVQASNHSDSRTPLRQALDALVDNTGNVFLVHGNIGSGKSSMAYLSQQRIWDAWKDEDSWVPLVIELKHVHKDTKDFLTAHLQAQPYGYSLSQIKTLQQDYRFFIILDGLDECPNASARHITHDIKLQDWNAKVLVTARTEWLQQHDSDSLLAAGHRDMKWSLSEYSIAPFTSDQVDRYLALRYANTDRPFFYNDFLKQDITLDQLTASPLMLHILCEVLPPLISQNNPEHTRFKLYDAFFDAWFEREIAKEDAINTVSRAADEQLKREFLSYTQILAYTMLCENTRVIERRHHQDNQAEEELSTLGAFVPVDTSDPWSAFFNRSKPAIQQALRSCPLSLEQFDREGFRYYRYQFIHLSFMEHAATTILWQALEYSLPMRLTVWNHRFLAEKQGVLAFLTERLMQSPTRESDEVCLMEMIYASRENPSYSKAASSAITLLHQSHYDFNNRIPNRDLSGISIPHADLTNAFLPGIDLSRSDLSHAIFHNAMLVGASLREADLTNTRFSADERPWNTPTNALSNITNGLLASVSNNKIIISPQPLSPNAHISEATQDKILTGHTHKITNLAFAPNGILASSSLDGTIRLWNISEATCIKILPEHMPTFESIHLAFSPNGKWLISGNSAELLLWNPENWDTPPFKLPFGSDHFSLHENFLSVSHRSSIFTLDLTDAPRTLHWLTSSPSTLWLQNCDITDAHGLSPSTQAQLKEEGAVSKAVKYEAARRSDQKARHSERSEPPHQWQGFLKHTGLFALKSIPCDARDDADGTHVQKINYVIKLPTKTPPQEPNHEKSNHLA